MGGQAKVSGAKSVGTPSTGAGSAGAVGNGPGNAPFNPMVDGNFPGFTFALGVVEVWQRAMATQANIWNRSWQTMTSGNYQPKDYFEALTQTTEAMLTAGEEVLACVFDPRRASGPVWVALSNLGPQEVRVNPPRPLVIDEALQLSPLSRLGGGEGQAPQVEVLSSGGMLVVYLPTGGAKGDPGQYVGLVTSKRETGAPLAVVTVTIQVL
jgi:hypothetical protein